MKNLGFSLNYVISASLLLFLPNFSSGTKILPSNVHYVEPGVTLNCCIQRLEIPEIYCYKGRDKHIVHLWETVQLHLSLSSDQFEQFDGSSPEEVMSKFDEHRSSWYFNFFLPKKKNIRLNPFNQTCIGIVTDYNYSLYLQLIRVDYWKILFLISGICLFLSAPKLSHNSVFYYITGISFGTCASFLILVFIISRFLPRKPVMYGFLVGGWSVGVYLIQLLVDNLRLIAVEYKSYVIGYCAITGLISFVICYRFGPVSDPRSKNLIKWAMQGSALIVMFCSSEFQEASLAVILIFLLVYNVPAGPLLRLSMNLRKYWFKPTPKLLTEDEYYHQGVVETQRALDELRGYCSSPECNQWKTVLRLRHPLRFANFMEGASHLEDEEVLAFETDMKTSVSEELLTDDSSSD